MSAYSTTPVVSPQSPVQNADSIARYSHPPPSPNNPPHPPQAYMNVDPQLNHNGGHQAHSQLYSPNHSTPRNKKVDHSSDGKARLRKACDSCSVRKVKCDETGPPCKACVGLEIPCTFNRQSKRRGPPNRHAEIVKKGRYDPSQGPGMMGISQPSSPTHAAQTLASFAQQQVLSADAVCPFPVLHSLVDDFFTYIHPLIPLPHKPSFLEALNRREDTNNTTFLALLASMIGCLAASFPRRPRHHFRAHNMEHAFPNSMSFVNRCQQVTMQAQGPGHLNGRLTIHDAIISYFWGITGCYTYDRQSTLINLNQCLTILNTIGVRKTTYANVRPLGAPQAKMVSNGHVPEVSHPEAIDYVLQELGKRTFWVAFVTVRSVQQSGVSPSDLNITPATKSHPYPPLPLEIDDEHITPTQVYPQPIEVISELVGFNANARVFITYNELSSMDLTHDDDELFDWERQKRTLEDSLEAVKRACQGLPTEISLNLQASQPPEAQDRSQYYSSPEYGLPRSTDIDLHSNNGGFDNRPIDYNRLNERRRIQYEIQKANLYASQLGTRSYLVERYWNLSDAHQSQTNGAASSATSTTHTHSSPHPPNHTNMTEQDMVHEREDIIKTLMTLLSSINRLNMEPNGTSFITKIRQIASTLLDKPRTRKGALAVKAEDYLRAFLEILMKLERVDPQHGGFGEGSEDDEEVQLRHWADMSLYQQRFAQHGGFLQDL